MPIDIQNRISYMIDTAVDMRIPPAIEATNTIVGDCDKNASLESERDLGLLPENEATKATLLAVSSTTFKKRTNLP
jgi:hypothetical protein